MHDLPFTRRQILAGAVAVLLVAVLGMRLLSGSPGGAAAPPIPTATAGDAGAAAPAAGELVVDVVGAVRRPGLYRLPHGSRIADAVERAGGTTRTAQLDLLNLAAPVADGEQVVVPRRGPSATSGSAGGSPGAPSGGPVHLSTATLEQLDALPGVGPVTAQKILDYRQQNGAFTSVEELDAVPGIGPARLEQLKDLVAP